MQLIHIFNACNGSFIWQIPLLLLGAALLGYLLKHFMGGQAQNRLIQATNGAWENKYNIVQNDLRTMETNNATVLRQHNTLTKEFNARIQSLEAELRSANEEKNRYASHAADWENNSSINIAKAKNLEEQLLQLQTKTNEQETMWASRFTAVEQSLLQAQQGAEVLRKEQADTGKLKADLSAAQKKLLETELRLKAAGELAGKVEPLQQELGLLQSRFKEATDQSEAHQAAVENLKLQLSEALAQKQSATAEQSRLSGLLSQKENDIAAWSKKAETAQAEKQSTEENLQHSQSRIAALEASLQTAKQFEGKVSELERTVQDWQQKHGNLQSELQNKKNELNVVNDQLAAASNNAIKAGAWEAAAKDWEYKHQQLQAQLGMKEEALSDWEQKWKSVENANARATKAESELSSLTLAHQNLQQEFAQLKSGHQHLESRLSLVPASAMMKKDKPDDLKIVEGIGPKIESLLHDDGILYYEQLADAPYTRIRGVLERGGDQFNMHDPSTWGWQAHLAAGGKWGELKELQDSLKGGRKMQTAQPAAPVKKDDLKIVEGIGPKIESLLHAADIFSFRQLSETAVSRLKEILVAAGERFRMHEPGTWPQQAALAASGNFKELQILQDGLKAGKQS